MDCFCVDFMILTNACLLVLLLLFNQMDHFNPIWAIDDEILESI